LKIGFKKITFKISQVQKKKVLIFIDWYLPGYKAGGPIQSVANLVAHLKDEFEFSIITRDTDYCETIPYPSVKSDEWNTLPNGVKVFYISQNNLSRTTIKNLIRKSDFDVVYLNGIYSIYFTLIPMLFLRKKHDKRVVIAARGMLSEGSLNVKKTKKQFFIRATKVLNLFDKVVFHATTESEKKDIRKHFGNTIQIQLAGNLSQKLDNNSFFRREKVVGKLNLISVARISPEKNLLFALEILKNVKSKVEFDIYGPVYNQIYWDECNKVINTLPANVIVNYKGTAESDSVMSLLRNAHALFMPSTGENFGHIILQSFLAACPVIISDATPWKFLSEKRVGWDIPLDQKQQFVNAIDAAAGLSQEAFNELSSNAFDFANNYVNNPDIISQNRSLFI